MPIKYHYDRTANVLVSQSIGLLSLGALLDVFDGLRDLRMDKNYLAFGDFRAADFTQVSRDDISSAKRRSIEESKVVGGRDKFALLTANAFGYEVGRLYAMSSQNDSFVMDVFMNSREALGWLGLSAGKVIKIAAEGGIELQL